ncbi:DUF6683 family protein, partial [Deinococcus sp.]|uniref:DUF6683 family protein n=1 Tax=Deinococcus sp. TaxID=47478 RepID=UPI0025F2E5EB
MKRLIVFVMFFSFSVTFAQSVEFYQNYDYSRIIYQQMDRVAEDNRDIYEDKSGGKSAAGTVPGANSASSAAALSFKPSSRVSEAVTKVMLSSLSKAENKPIAQVLSEITAQQNEALPPIVIAQVIRAKNLPVNNVASYFNAFVAASYTVISGKSFVSTQRQMFYTRSSQLLGKVFARSSDTVKQQMSEYLAWEAQRIVEQNRRSPQAARKSALAVLE